MTTSGTTNGNKWQRLVQLVTTSGRTSDNKWQRVTTNENEWYNKWQRVAQRMNAIEMNESDFRSQSKAIVQCITTIYSATSFCKYNVKQNICRSSHRRCSKKQLLLKISQYSQENTWRPATLLKRDSYTSVFLWALRNF